MDLREFLSQRYPEGDIPSEDALVVRFGDIENLIDFLSILFERNVHIRTSKYTEEKTSVLIQVGTRKNYFSVYATLTDSDPEYKIRFPAEKYKDMLQRGPDNGEESVYQDPIVRRLRTIKSWVVKELQRTSPGRLFNEMMNENWVEVQRERLQLPPWTNEILSRMATRTAVSDIGKISTEANRDRRDEHHRLANMVSKLGKAGWATLYQPMTVNSNYAMCHVEAEKERFKNRLAPPTIVLPMVADPQQRQPKATGRPLGSFHASTPAQNKDVVTTQFLLVLMSPGGIHLHQKLGRVVIHIDATWGLNAFSYPTYIIGVLMENGRFCPTAYAVTSGQGADVVQQILEFLIERTGVTPMYCCADNDLSEAKAFAATGSKLLRCWFHVTQIFERQMELRGVPQAFRRPLQALLAKMHNAETLDSLRSAMNAVEEFCLGDAATRTPSLARPAMDEPSPAARDPKLARFYTEFLHKQWLADFSTVLEWCRLGFLCVPEIQQNNNPLERYNRFIKHQLHFKRLSMFFISHLVHLLVEADLTNMNRRKGMLSGSNDRQRRHQGHSEFGARAQRVHKLISRSSENPFHACIPSISKEGVSYGIDLSDMSCSCPSFKLSCNSHPWCKHIQACLTVSWDTPLFNHLCGLLKVTISRPNLAYPEETVYTVSDPAGGSFTVEPARSWCTCNYMARCIGGVRNLPLCIHLCAALSASSSRYGKGVAVMHRLAEEFHCFTRTSVTFDADQSVPATEGQDASRAVYYKVVEAHDEEVGRKRYLEPSYGPQGAYAKKQKKQEARKRKRRNYLQDVIPNTQATETQAPANAAPGERVKVAAYISTKKILPERFTKTQILGGKKIRPRGEGTQTTQEQSH